MSSLPEVWLRGPVPGIPPLLQPVAHALLQVREELQDILADFPAADLWLRPAGVASVGFHLQHMTGVLDRLSTYARGERLTAEQFAVFEQEEHSPGPDCQPADLLRAFSEQVARTVDQLRRTTEAQLAEPRGVGRAQLPSTVLGLLFHGAEHTTRHLGQLLVTARILRDLNTNPPQNPVAVH